MIVSRTPFRVSFVGGGSDLASFYSKYRGAVISTSINKYMYINLHKNFHNKYRIAYSSVEEVDELNKINHPLVRNTLDLLNLTEPVEITSTADIPSAGTGLGSSSSYTVGLIKSLTRMQGKDIGPYELSELACKVEIELCGDPVGKQDQYAAAFGGLNKIYFNPDGSVEVQPLMLDDGSLKIFFEHMLFVYIGNYRKTNIIMNDQNKNNETDENISNLREMVSLVDQFGDELKAQNYCFLGEMLNHNWNLKKTLSKKISNNGIDNIYQKALESGAIGGKLLGAGGGGFMLFIVEPGKRKRLIEALKNLRVVDFSFDRAGASIVYNGGENV